MTLVIRLFHKSPTESFQSNIPHFVWWKSSITQSVKTLNIQVYRFMTNRGNTFNIYTTCTCLWKLCSIVNYQSFQKMWHTYRQQKSIRWILNTNAIFFPLFDPDDKSSYSSIIYCNMTAKLLTHDQKYTKVKFHKIFR